MSVRQSLLAILDQGSCYGNQLRSEFDRRTGATGPINVGQIYNTLDRLERDGLVSKSEPESGSPDSTGQIYYSITDTGRTEVAGWFRSPVERSTSARDELAIKVAIAVTLPNVDASRILDAHKEAVRDQVRALQRELQDLNAGPTTEILPRALLIDASLRHLEADVQWLDHVAGRLSEAASRGETAVLPLSTEVPKRGRPARSATAGSRREGHLEAQQR